MSRHRTTTQAPWSRPRLRPEATSAMSVEEAAPRGGSPRERSSLAASRAARPVGRAIPIATDCPGPASATAGEPHRPAPRGAHRHPLGAIRDSPCHQATRPSLLNRRTHARCGTGSMCKAIRLTLQSCHRGRTPRTLAAAYTERAGSSPARAIPSCLRRPHPFDHDHELFLFHCFAGRCRRRVAGASCHGQTALP